MAPTTSVSDKATCIETSSVPSRRSAAPALAVRGAARRASPASERKAHIAEQAVITSAMPSASAAAAPSVQAVGMLSTVMTLSAVESNRTSPWLPQMPSSTPRAVPVVVSSRPSVSSCRSRRPRPAPIARRKDNSWPRASVRLSIMLAMVPQPTISSRATSAVSNQSGC